MSKTITTSAAYGDKTDRILTTLQIGAVLSPLIEGALTGYLLPPADTLWLFGAIPAALLLFCLGRACQRFLSGRLKWEKPVYHKEKTWREYFTLSRSLLSLLISLLVGAAFFAVACRVRQWNYALTEHETDVHAAGFLYETAAAVCGILVFYIGSLSWFCPDEILFSNDFGPILSILVPAGVMACFAILFSVPVAAILLCAALYFGLMLVRKIRVDRYEKTLRAQKRSEDDEKDKARWG